MKQTPEDEKSGYVCLAFFVLAYLLSLLLVYLPVGFFVVVGLICYAIHLLNKASKHEQIDKKIRAIKNSNVVFIESSKLYTIPLQASATEIIVLHPTLSGGYEPTLSGGYKPMINFKEIKTSLADISLVSKFSRDSSFYTINQISSVAKDLYLNVEPQRKDLKSKLSELKRLEKLALFSELYKQQADLYSRASHLVKELLDSSEKLSKECHSFVTDLLIGQELAQYNADNFPDILIIRMRLDSRCKQVSDQYKLLKSEMDEYMELKDELSKSKVIPPTKNNR